MAPVEAHEPIGTLLKSLKQKGFPVSRAQLRRWQAQGLIPRPRQIGLGYGRGSQVVYPPGTKRQVLRLCELLREKRSVDRARKRLWIEGFEITEGHAREFFRSLARESKSLRDSWIRDAEAIDVEGGPDLAADLERAANARIEDRNLRRARRRIGRRAFSILAVAISKASAGVQVELDEEARDLLMPTLAPDAPADVHLNFGLLRELFEADRVRRVAETTSIEAIQTARNDIAVARATSAYWAPSFREILGPGLDQFLDQFIEDLDPDLFVSATFAWLLFRDLRSPAAIDKLKSVLPDALQEMKSILLDTHKNKS